MFCIVFLYIVFKIIKPNHFKYIFNVNFNKLYYFILLFNYKYIIQTSRLNYSQNKMSTIINANLDEISPPLASNPI